MHHLGDYFISWSHPNNSQTDCIIVFDANTMEIVNTYDRGPQLLQEGNFYSYNEDLFFFKHQENRVYTVTKDSLSLAYRWDFGKDNLKMNHLDMIITLNPNNYDNVKPFLSEAERKKLDALTEDDNPCLLKLHFKK